MYEIEVKNADIKKDEMRYSSVIFFCSRLYSAHTSQYTTKELHSEKRKQKESYYQFPVGESI